MLNKSDNKISKIAGLNNDQINELILQLNVEIPSLATQTSNMMKALLDVDELLFNRVFETSVENIIYCDR